MDRQPQFGDRHAKDDFSTQTRKAIHGHLPRQQYRSDFWLRQKPLYWEKYIDAKR